MTKVHNQHRALGRTGLHVPPICFGSAALGNVNRVIPEQSKLAICGEWIRGVSPPVWINADYRHGEGVALEVLGRMLRRLDVAGDDVVVDLVLDGGRSSRQGVADCWEKSCLLLGDDYRPKLVSIDQPNDDVWRAANELMNAGQVAGVGMVFSDLQGAKDLMFSREPDWLTLRAGFTPMRQQAEAIALVSAAVEKQTPIVLAGVFERGFLVGGNQLDGRELSTVDPTNRALFAWRKAFVALCDGHGIRPSHACIQFALSVPGVVALLVESSYPDRVAENINSVCQKVPDNFWASMKEEGLLAKEWPL
jgi:D-threo-aldose 1-dehydrogenase